MQGISDIDIVSFLDKKYQRIVSIVEWTQDVLSKKKSK